MSTRRWYLHGFPVDGSNPGSLATPIHFIWLAAALSAPVANEFMLPSWPSTMNLILVASSTIDLIATP